MKPEMKTYGRLTTSELPTMQEAIEADLEQGSHHLTNLASEEFAKKYPTILAVSIAADERSRRLMDVLPGLVRVLRDYKLTRDSGGDFTDLDAEVQRLYAEASTVEVPV